MCRPMQNIQNTWEFKLHQTVWHRFDELGLVCSSLMSSVCVLSTMKTTNGADVKFVAA